MVTVFYAFLWFLVLGGFSGFILVLVAQKTQVSEDARKQKILSSLPGANCGGCGFAGCSAFADAVVEKGVHPSLCRSLETGEQEKICRLMNLEPQSVKKEVAHVMCFGGIRAKEKYQYEGISDCRIAARLAGGKKMCHNGCMGLGNCERACEFDALHVIDGVAVVDPEKCRSCTACVRACPKGIIQMIPADAHYTVSCCSQDKGKDVLRFCETGCIGCKKCEKVCQSGAISVEGCCAVIDQKLCTSCGACVAACPRGIIHKRF